MAIQQRLLSLDVFRGITVATMVLVNNPGSWGKIYSPLKHAEWHGCTPTDLIFPFFLYIMGVSIVFALGSKKENRQEHGNLILRAFRRGLVLFLLGLILALIPSFDFSTVRIMGVLQRIGIVFFVCAVLFIKTGPKTQFKVLVAILLAYWTLMTLVPVPGVGNPNLEKETSLAAWIDRLVLTEQHTWKSSRTWDPEGLLSTLPAIGTGILGMLTGSWIRRKDKNDSEKTAWLFASGFMCMIAGLAFGLFFPINKSLWTSSYVLYTGGLAAMGFGLLYWMVDVQGYRRFTGPFVAYGINAISVFFLSALVVKTMSRIKIPLDGELVDSKTWLYKTFFSSWLSAYNASLAWALAFTLAWLILLWPMYKKNIIIKI